jgi:D-alanyl-D-alanine carboxypeptidase
MNGDNKRMKSRGKKIMVWILIVLLVVLSSGAGVFIYTTNQQVNNFSKYIQTAPMTTAVVAYTYDDAGEPVMDDSALFYNADTPLVLASSMKVIVLAAYENAVLLNLLDPNEQVRLTDVEKYYLPKTDGGAHIQGLASLGIAVDTLGFASDPYATILLDDVARIMIHYSGNAETDYLIDRIGLEQVNAVHDMTSQTVIRQVLGPALAITNHENNLFVNKSMGEIVEQANQGDFSYLDHLVDLYLHDPEWRSLQIDYMRSDAYVASANQLGWAGQVKASQMFPRGTAREYAHMMAKIASGQFVSNEVSIRMQKKLESAPGDQLLRTLFFKRYGAKDGLTAGILNITSYCTPKWGKLNGQDRVVVILTNELPYDQWLTGMKSMSIYLLQAKLARGSYVFSE